jgi:hypothetical protein
LIPEPLAILIFGGDDDDDDDVEGAPGCKMGRSRAVVRALLFGFLFCDRLLFPPFVSLLDF